MDGQDPGVWPSSSPDLDGCHRIHKVRSRGIETERREWHRRAHLLAHHRGKDGRYRAPGRYGPDQFWALRASLVLLPPTQSLVRRLMNHPGTRLGPWVP